MFTGVPDDPAPTDTGGHQRTPNGPMDLTKVTVGRTVPKYGTRSAAEDSESCSRPVARVGVEFGPHPMLAGEQLLAGTDAATVLGRQRGRKCKGVIGEREEEHEVETLSGRRIVHNNGECFGYDSSEQRRPRYVTGSRGRHDWNQLGPSERLGTAWDLKRSDRVEWWSSRCARRAPPERVRRS